MYSNNKDEESALETPVHIKSSNSGFLAHRSHHHLAQKNRKDVEYGERLCTCYGVTDLTHVFILKRISSDHFPSVNDIRDTNIFFTFNIQHILQALTSEQGGYLTLGTNR